MHLYSTPLNITSAPTAYAVLGCQVGIVCAELASGRSSSRNSRTQVLTMIRGVVFMVKLLGGRRLFISTLFFVTSTTRYVLHVEARIRKFACLFHFYPNPRNVLYSTLQIGLT